MRTVKIYLAGAMSNLTYEEMNEWRKRATELFQDTDYSVYTVNPCDYYNFDLDRESYSELEVMDFDLQLVKEADIILVNLDFPVHYGKVLNSVGTATEIIMAHKIYNKPVIAFGFTTVHPWIEVSVRKRLETLEEAVEHIVDFYLPHMSI